MENVAKLPLEYLLAALALVFALGLIAFVIAMGWLAGALKNIKSLFERQVVAAQQIGPQPFEVKAAASFAAHTDFLRLEVEFKELRSERKKDVSSLHDRIDRLDREMGGVAATLSLQTAHLDRIEDKIDQK